VFLEINIWPKFARLNDALRPKPSKSALNYVVPASSAIQSDSPHSV